MKTTFIYALKEQDGDVRYVGKSDTPKKRFRQHRTNNRKEQSHKVDWLNYCQKNGIPVEMIILEECSYEQWQDRECHWINQFSNLVNHDKGGRGGKPIKYPMSYEDCKLWVKNNIPYIDSESKWISYRQNLPDFISKYPRDTYLSRGWISWGDFLGTNRIHDIERGKKFLSYAEAQKWCVENNIKSGVDYRKRYIKDLLPINPNRKYKEWVSWFDFLYTKNIKKPYKYVRRSTIFLPLDEFTIWLKQTHPHIKTSTQFFKWSRNDIIPNYIPKNPSTAYRNKGWRGWPNFFASV